MTLTTVARGLFASLLVAVILVPGSASAGLPADNDLSYDNPRYADAATLAVEGTLETVVTDGFNENAGATYTYGIRTEQGDLIEVPAAFAKDAPTDGRFEGELALTGALASDIRAEGVAVTPGKVIDADTAAGQTAAAVASDQQAPVPVASATVTEPVAAAATPGAHKLYVAVMNGAVPASGVIDQIRNYWIAESDGAITSFDVAQTETFADPLEGCGLSSDADAELIWTEAARKFPGVLFTDGKHLMVIVPSSCGGSGGVGIGTVGSSIANGGKSIVSAGSGVVQIGAHELGHNFGLGHANLEHCASSCAVDSYYDAYSVMGFAINAFSPPALDTAYRSFLDVADEVDDIVLTGVTTVELEPRSEEIGRRGLRIIDPETGAEYFVEYRSGTGGDASAFYANGSAFSNRPYRYGRGIVITQQYTSSQDHGRLTKVLTRRSGLDYLSSLAANETYTSPSGIVTIAAGAQGSNAQVVVTLGGPVTSAVPTVSPAPRVQRTVTAVTTGWDPDAALTYQWRINGKEVSYAKSFTIPSAYYNTLISVAVTGAKSGFLRVTRTSAAIRVAPGYLSGGPPRINGTPAVGNTLKIAMVPWTPGTRFTYRWYANGAAISKATKSTYKITKSKRGKYITVKVKGSRWAFQPATVTSARTARVR